MLETLFVKYCRHVGAHFRSRASDELTEAVERLAWGISAEDVIGAGKAAMLGIGALGAALAWLAAIAAMNPLIPMFVAPMAIIAYYAITEWPKTVYRERALDALGQSPHLIAQIAIPLKQRPNLEHALEFAATNAEGPIADDIRDMLWKTAAGKIADPSDGLDDVGKKWGKLSSGFQRAVGIILASFHEPDRKKAQQMLDASMSVMLDDIVGRTKEYMRGLSMPTLVLFGIGMVLPLMLVSLFPMLALFNVGGGAGGLAAFLAVLLGGTYMYSNAILRKRPPTFSRPTLEPSKRLRIGGRELDAAPLAAVAGIILATPGILYLLGEGGMVMSGPLAAASAIGTIVVLWAIAIAGAVYCWGTAKDAAKTRAEVVELEDGFVTGLEHFRNRLADGRPVEDAIEFASRFADSETAGFFAALCEKMRRTSEPFERIAANVEVQSALVRGTLRMLANSVSRGMAATMQTASVIIAYLKRMQRAEKALAAMLQRSLSMMKATAITFAPAVCAIIVVLFQMMTKTIERTHKEIGESGMMLQVSVSPEILQLVVGLYALSLNFVLLRFVSRMAHGADPLPFRMALSKALPIAMTIYTVTLIAMRIMLSGYV